jgi:hypothetical protein
MAVSDTIPNLIPILSFVPDVCAHLKGTHSDNGGCSVSTNLNGWSDLCRKISSQSEHYEVLVNIIQQMAYDAMYNLIL